MDGHHHIHDLSSVNDFPYLVSPFPDSTHLLCSHPTALIQPSDTTPYCRNPYPPPQKLRPIRFHDRSSAPGSLSGENPESGSSLQVEASEALRKEDCDCVAGNGCLQAETPVGVGSGNQLERESGSSWDNDDNLSQSKKKLGIVKIRKKRIRKIEAFLENLVMKVMEKQDQMQKQLVDVIVNKERERMMREEAWKQQEIERMKKEEEARTKEKSRNLALISIIQSVLVHKIEIPQPAIEDASEVTVKN